MSRALSVNPIWQKCARARLRVPAIASWGAVWLTITAFVSLMTYLSLTEQEMASPSDAAKAVLPAIFIIQAVILMMFGSGAVANGVAAEREEGLVDYQRMTPMSPTAKILGYLFGLPVREYVLFAMTLPFVIVAVVISNFNLLTLLHFYAVFFTSVWVYHMTGLAAGMVVPKPRWAQLFSMGIVAALYFILPNLSRLGITFFEFLTIRPTLFGLIWQELPESMRGPAEASGIDSFRPVPLFGAQIHPTAYTLLVQGFMISVLWIVVWRKWRDETSHVLSKVTSLYAFGGVLMFLLASVWAVIVQEDAYRQIFAAFEESAIMGPRQPETLEILLFMSIMIVGAAYVLVIAATTPTRHTIYEGWRRARKHGRARLPINADASSSLPSGLIMIALTVAAGASIVVLAGQNGYYRQGPSAASVLVLLAGLVGIGLFVQGLRERTSIRVFAVTTFLLWMVPLFTLMILFAAFEAFVPGSYLGLACPPVTLFYGVATMLESTTPLAGIEPEFLPDELRENAWAITLTGSLGYLAAGVAMQALRWRRWRQIRQVREEPSMPGVSADASAAH